MTDTTAIRVHVKPRKANFTPNIKTTYPGSGKETDPWFDRLGPTRTTYVRFKSRPHETIELLDDWAHMANKDELLGEEWIAETHFTYEPVRETVERHNVTTAGHNADYDIGHRLGWK